MDKQEYAARVAWLRRYQESLRREKALLLEIEQLRSRAERVTRALTGMPGPAGDGVDALPICVADMIEAEQRLQGEMQYGQMLRSEIKAELMQAVAGKEYEVMSLRYLSGIKFEAIAQNLELSPRWVYRLHKKAICKIWNSTDLSNS